MTTTVVGLGQRQGGDDGVGLEVVDALERRPPKAAVLRRLREPSQLVDAIAAGGRLIVVDAVDDPERVGRVDVCPSEAFDAGFPESLSSHGLGVARAIELARTLYGAAAEVSIVSVAIDVAAIRGHHRGLSAPVAAAVPRAERRIRALLERPRPQRVEPTERADACEVD